jgi:methyl-accepting chemotaxis protein
MKLTIRLKIFISSFIPVLILTSILAFLSVMDVKGMGEAEIKQVESKMLEMKKAELKNYVDLAINSLTHLTGRPDNQTEEVINEVKNMLRHEKFGDDGYIFVYDQKGINIVFPPDPSSLEGKNLWDMQDEDGMYLVRELVKKANEGGGFLTYKWMKPSKNSVEKKLSYSTLIKEYNWMIGTGFYIDDIDEEIAIIKNKVNQEVKAVIMQFTIVSTIGLLVIFVLSSIVAKKISNTIKGVSASLHELAEGEGDLTRRLEVETSDEVGELCNYFNDFMGKMNDIIATVKDNADVVASSSSELAATTEQLSTTMSDQSEQISGVASATEEMSVSAKQVSGSLDDSQVAMTETHNLTVEGTSHLNKAVEEMNEISEKVELLGETVQRLLGSSKEIENILSVITDIADQTNLLALNAAIEAARAGDHGRGFAVVADEVRKLAERTQQSTGEITSIIVNLQKETDMASKGMNSAKEKVESGVGVISQTQEVFGHIVSSVEKMSEVNGAIGSSVNEQTTAIYSINESAQVISSGVEESSSALVEVTTTISTLQVQADELKVLVDKFKLSK